MTLRAVIRSVPLNLLAAAAGMAGTLYISWVFGLEVFATYTINIAKLSLILLGLEFIPSSYSIFRQQEDYDFSSALPSFYALFALLGAALAAALIVFGWFDGASWIMVAITFFMVLQRYLDCQSQAKGVIGDFFWVPVISNFARVLALIGQVLWVGREGEEQLWLSLLVGTVLGQVYMLIRYPSFFKALLVRPKWTSFRYLLSLRANYYPYYINSVLKRAKDTYIPLFCDYFMVNKAEAGAFFLYFRAVDFACAQMRMMEAFLSNRQSREELRGHRKVILLVSAISGQLASILVSLFLVGREGIDSHSLMLSITISFYVYPYMLELFKRSDSYADFTPRRVTVSLSIQLLGTLAFLTVSMWFGALNVLMLILALLVGQSLAAVSYFSPIGRSN